MHLNAAHIDYIIKDLHYRGIVHENFQHELIDHVCSAVEAEMEKGTCFIDAFHTVLISFGHTRGLRKTQEEILRAENPTPIRMLRNYWNIALRNLVKHRFYTFINVTGLAIGIASCLIITVYLLHELSYDKHHENYLRIHRVNGEIKFGPNHYKLAVTPAPMAEALLKDFPEVEAVTRFRTQGTYLVKRDKESFREQNITFTDSTVFKVFTFHFLEGSPSKALTEPNTIVISKRIADKYFPNESAIGQSLIFFDDWNTKITGVIENMPLNSHFHFDILISMTGLDESRNGNWLSNNFQTYVLLRNGADPKALESKLPKMIETYVGPQAAEVLGGEFTMKKFFESGNKYIYWLTPLQDIHLHSDLGVEIEPNGSIAYIYLFGAIALFILSIACVNFMNLSTARSSSRAKEVGIRKVLGSLRSHLVRQFLLESILLSVCAFVLAIGLAYLLLPQFNTLANKELNLPLTSISFYLIVLVASVLIGVLAGVYPSFFLSSFRPIQVLKGKFAVGMKSGLIRSGLVVFQFSVSIFLMIGTFVVFQQLNFIQNTKIGFNKDQVIVIHDAYSLNSQLQSFKDELLRDSKILSGSISGHLPVAGTDRNDNTHWPEGKQPTEENMVGLQNWDVDYDYVKTLGMTIKEGRDFSRDFPSDSSAIILNEAAVKAFGFGKDAIGKRITTFANTADNSVDKNATISFTVIGVVEDFHFESLRQSITPLYLHLGNNSGMISFRFEAKNTQAVIQDIEKTWKKMASGKPFLYSFLNEDFGRMYASEQRLGTIFACFACLAIIIASLGLFALSAFMAEQRTKEIGIRKVFGASIGSIVLLLSREFGKLVLIAFILSAPLAWYAITWWLTSYTYKVDVGILVFILAGVAAFLVAWITISFQSIKAARNNPVQSLRSE